MTWIIGGSTMFGYGVMISDICVSFGQGNSKDCLQKIYPVGNHILGGFAGSVELGFMMLQNLRDFLKLPEKEQEECAWYPDWVGENWAPEAKRIFSRVPDNLKALGCQIIMVGTHPTEDIGIPGFAKTYVVILKSPDFNPHIESGGNKFLSIGSGAYIGEYVKELEEATSLYGNNSLVQTEIHHPGGFGNTLKIALSSVLRDNPHIGISKHLHLAIINRGTYTLSTNDTTIHYTKEHVEEIKMPRVAKSYPEFLGLVSNKISPEKAIC